MVAAFVALLFAPLLRQCSCEPSGLGLEPTKGAWRGAAEAQSYGTYDPATWRDMYGPKLHIFRMFPEPGKEAIWDSLRTWVLDGGILFYSIQPFKAAGGWRKAASAEFKPQIRKYAEAVKSLAPHQVMVAAGFEPDHHVVEIVGESKGWGTVQEYRDMFESFRSTFEEEGVSNAVWVMDYAGERVRLDIVQALWPDNHVVGWLLFNYFQGNEIDKLPGDCKAYTEQYYHTLRNLSNAKNGWADIPWGLGAWGTKNVRWSDPSKSLSLDSRERCLDGMTELFMDRENYPKLKAQIYYNAKDSQLDDYPTLVQRLKKLNGISTFSRNDAQPEVQV